MAAAKMVFRKADFIFIIDVLFCIKGSVLISVFLFARDNQTEASKNLNRLFGCIFLFRNDEFGRKADRNN
jgi:hypothetical protein